MIDVWKSFQERAASLQSHNVTLPNEMVLNQVGQKDPRP